MVGDLLVVASGHRETTVAHATALPSNCWGNRVN